MGPTSAMKCTVQDSPRHLGYRLQAQLLDLLGLRAPFSAAPGQVPRATCNISKGGVLPLEVVSSAAMQMHPPGLQPWPNLARPQGSSVSGSTAWETLCVCVEGGPMGGPVGREEGHW